MFIKLSSSVLQFFSVVTTVMMLNDNKRHDLDASLTHQMVWLLFKVIHCPQMSLNYLLSTKHLSPVNLKYKV